MEFLKYKYATHSLSKFVLIAGNSPSYGLFDKQTIHQTDTHLSVCSDMGTDINTKCTVGVWE